MTKRPTEPGDWSDSSAALLRSMATSYTPSDADCERVRRALLQRLSDPAQLPTLSAETTASVGARTLTKLLPTGIALACLVTAAFVFTRHELDNVPGTQPLAAHDRAVHATAQHDSLAPNERVAQAPRTVPETLEPPSTDVATSTPQGVSTGPRATRRRKLTTAAERTTPAHRTTPDDVSTPPPPSAAGPTAHTAASAEQQKLSEPSARDVDSTRLAAATTAVHTPSPASDTTARGEAAARDARAELAWLDTTRTALQKSKLSAVLALCAEHARRWPQGMFVQEREALGAIAACRSAADGAEARAARFFRNYPLAPLRPHVEEACNAATRRSSDSAR